MGFRGVTGVSLVALAALLLLGGCRSNRAVAVEEAKSPAEREEKSDVPRPAEHATTVSLDFPGFRPALVSDSLNASTSGSAVFGFVRMGDGTPATGTVVSLLRHGAPGSQVPDRVVTRTLPLTGILWNLNYDPEPGLVLRAVRPGACAVEWPLPDPVPDSPRRRRVDFWLTPAVRIAGRVVDGDGTPLSGIEVSYTRTAPQGGRFLNTGSTLSDAEGRFSFDDVAKGKVTLAFRSDHSVPLTRNVQAPDENLTITLNTRGASIAGHVFRLGNREGVASATVSLWAGSRVPGPGQKGVAPVQEVTADPLGAFRFDHLSSGTYVLSARSGDLRQIFPGGKTPVLRLDDDETTEGIAIYLYGGHTVEGTVLDRRTSQPLEGVRITADCGEGQIRAAETAADGRYLLPALFGDGDQTVELKIEKEGYTLSGVRSRKQTLKVPLPSDRFQVTRDIELAPLVRVSGTVRSAEGAAIPDATVRPVALAGGEAGQESSADAEGRFELRVYPRTPLRVAAQAPGYGEGHSAPVEVLDQDIQGVEVVLQKGATVSGMVTDEQDNPVAGATVIAILAPHGGSEKAASTRRTEKSGPDGTFTFSDVPAREISLVAAKPPLVRSAEELVTLRPGETKGGVRLVLRSAKELSGRVVDGDGKPVAGAQVVADSKVGRENNYGFATTGSDGRFSIRNLSDAPVDVAAKREGYLTARQAGVKPGTTDLELVLRQAAEVLFIGTVVEAGTFKPVEDFTVRTVGKGKVERKDLAPNQFSLEGLRQGDRYRVVVEASGYQPADSGWRLISSEDSTVEETFEIGTGGAIIGRTVTEGTREPVAGLSVELLRPTDAAEGWLNDGVAPTVTGPDGRFRLEDVAAGEVTVLIQRDEPKLKLSRTISVGHSRVSDLGDIEIGEGAGVRGIVVRQIGEEPVAGATVVLAEKHTRREERTVTDQEGRFSFTGIRTAEYFLKLPEYRQSLYITLVEDRVREVTIRVGESALRGTILRAGQPVRAEVTLTQPGLDVEKTVRSDEEGVFEVTGLTPGFWRVSIFPATSGNQVRVPHNFSTEVPAIGTAEETYVLPSARVTGIVLGPDGSPVRDATVSLFLPGGTKPDGSRRSEQRASKTTGADGTFVFEGFPDGVIVVDARKAGVGSDRVEDVVVPEEGDAPPVTLRLKGGGTLRSVVLNMTTGNPVPTAWCNLYTAGGLFNHSARRDNKGEMIIRDIPPGQYHVEVSAYNYSVAEHVVEIQEGETVTLEDVLYEAGAVYVTMVDSRMKRLLGIPGRIVPDDPQSIEAPRSGVTDANGELKWRGLFPGRYTVTVEPPGMAPIVRQVNVLAHQPFFLLLEAGQQ